MAQNNYKNELAQIRAEIQAVEKSMLQLDATILKISASARTAVNNMKGFSPLNFNKKFKELQSTIDSLNRTIAEQEKKIQALTAAKQQAKNVTRQEVIEQRHARKEADLQAAATSKLVGAYNNLIAKRELAKRNLQRLMASEKANTAEIKRAQREYDVLTAKVNKVNKATSNFANTSLGGVVRGFKNLLGAFGIAGGVFLFADIARNIFDLTKRLQSLDYALKTIIPSAREFGNTKEFLTRIANSYGASIITLTERYTKFIAAAKQSNFSLSQTEQIFESVTKASGVLGLRQDELNGVFLALEQMISKGKVTTEELRRQLGERLPGAFGIMANALKVTVPELDRMLRAGEVLSSEALPKFAEELEKAYGIQAVNRVDTLVAAQERLTNAWVKFAESFRGEGGGQGAIKVMEFLTVALEDITRRFNRFFLIMDDGITTWQRYQIQINRLTAITGVFNGFFHKTVTNIEEEIKQRDLLIKSVREQAIATNLLYYEYQSLHGSIAPFLDEENYKKMNDFFNIPFISGAKSIRTYADVLADLKTERENLEKSTKEEAPEILKRIALLEKEAEAWGKGKKPRKENIEAIKGSLAYFEEQISKLEEQRSKLATNSEEWIKYTKLIEAAKKQLREFGEGSDPLAARGSLILDTKTEKTPDEIAKNVSSLFADVFGASPIDITTISVESLNEALRNTAKRLEETANREKEWADARKRREALGEAVFRSFETFSDMYDLDLEKFKFLFEGKDKTLKDYGEAAAEVAKMVLNSNLEKYDIELQEAQIARDLILENELSTEEQKRAARKQFEEKERKIKIEKAKQERQNALTQIAIDTALAVMNVFATTKPFIAALPLAAAVTGIGLAQAAFVASRPLPKFAEGHLSGTYQGPAIINDAKRNDYKEVVERKSGAVEVYKDRNAVIGMEKGDKVHKSFDSFFGYHKLNTIERDIWMMNLQNHSLKGYDYDKEISRKVSELTLQNERTWREVKKLASRPVNVTNKVIIDDKRPY